MARNPTISTSDIFGPRAHEPTVNVSAGEHIAQGLEQLTALGVGLRTEQLENQLSGELLQMQNEVVGAPGEPLKSPDVEPEQLTAEDQATADDFAARMAKLGRAERQGGQSITALKIKQEDLLRSYMTRYPHLTKNFQQAATGVLGYSPIGARLDAAEAAARAAASGEEYGWLEKTIINAAIARGINPALLLTDPGKFWSDANKAMVEFQQFSIEQQAFEALKQKRDMSKEVATPEFHAFVLRQHNSVLTSVVEPTMKKYFETIGITEGMSLEEKQIILMEAHRSGKFQTLVADLQAQRNAHLDRAYAKWIQTPGGYITDATGKNIPNMSKKEFGEAFSGVLAQYDWAIATLGDGGLVPIMEGLNQSLKHWATARLPVGVHVLAAMADVLKGNETLFTMLTSGQMQNNIAALLAADMLQYFGGNGTGVSNGWPVWEPPAAGTTSQRATPSFSVIPDSVGAGQFHRTPEEIVGENRGMTMERADSEYAKAMTATGTSILENFERYAQDEEYENSVLQAKMFSDLLQKYGQAAKRALNEGKVGFSTATNNSVLNLAADPRAAMVFRTLARAINQYGTPNGNREWVDTATFADLQESTMLYANQEWQAALMETTEQTGTNIAEDQTELPGSTEPVILENYIKPVFSTDTRTLQFKFKDDAPDYIQRSSSHLLKRLNRSLTGPRQYTIMTGVMAMTHLMLQVEQGAYERVIYQALLSNEDGGL